MEGEPPILTKTLSKEKKLPINDDDDDESSLKWYSTIAVLSGTLAPAGTFLKNTDKICAAD